MATAARRSTVPIPQDIVTRRGGLRSKTPSVNDLSKKLKNAPKGKRRLEFVEQPLKGKRFYLDLNGYKKMSSLTSQIQELGGKVEEFLSKDIHYLITNNKDADTRLSPTSNSTPSPGLSIPSPFPATTNKSSSMKGAWPSPLSGDSLQSVDPQPTSKHDTRGKAIMKQAQATLKNRYGTCNILTNARTWGVCVIYLEKALEKLADYGPRKVEKQPSIKELMVSGKKQLRVKIRKLQAPFIKVEDQSRNYRPLVKEFKQWPFPDFESPVGTCPFDTPRNRKDQETKKRPKEQPQDTKKQQAKQGYCECCCLHYDALDMHLKSDSHQSFARNDANYESLDNLIAQGPSLTVFLEKIKLKYSASHEAQNPFQTPTKDTEENSKNGEGPSPDSRVKKMTLKLSHCTQTKQTTPKNTTAEDGETKRVTRSSCSPCNETVNKENAQKMHPEEKYHNHKLVSSPGSNIDKTGVTTDENVEDGSLQKVPSKSFTRLRSLKKAVDNEVKQEQNKRVLRSKEITPSNNSDSTETLSDEDVIHRRRTRKHKDTVLDTSSTDSLLTKTVHSPRQPKIGKPTTCKNTEEGISSLIASQVESSPKSGHTVPCTSITDTPFNEQSSMLTQARDCTSVPKTRSSRKGSRVKRSKPKHKDVTSTGNENDNTSLSDNSIKGAVQNSEESGHTDLLQQQRRKELDETYTSLFDSDDDNEEFEGFDIPQFEVFSSEHELSYRIKEIVNYFTSSQDSTLVEESERGECNSENKSEKKKKKKRSPHGIKIILSSKTDNQDDDDDEVFEDDDDDDDTLSTVADSTDGNEDEQLLSSPLRMDTLYHKRKLEMEHQVPPKRRRTVCCDEVSLLSKEITSNSEKLNTASIAIEDIDKKTLTTRSGKLRSKALSDGHEFATASRDLDTVVRLKRSSNNWKIISEENHSKKNTSTLKTPSDGNPSQTTDKPKDPVSKESSEFLEPNVLMSIEERVKMRRIEKQKKESVEGSSSVEVTATNKGSTHKSTKKNDKRKSCNQVNSTPLHQKSISSPTNKSPNPSWIFHRNKFLASTPQSSRKTRSKSTGNKKETLRKLRSRCLSPGDSYEFVGEDVYVFE